MRQDYRELIRDERLSFADELETLAADEWAAPSLCPAWTVQQVAAHLASAPAMGPAQMLVELGRSGLRINRFLADSATRWSERGPEAIVRQLRRNAERQAKPTGMPDAAVLCDAVVHGLDVRVPLSRNSHVDRRAARLVLDFLVTSGRRFPASVLLGRPGGRVAGLCVEVPELDWSHGTGETLRAEVESALLLLSGRPVGPDGLSGPGATHVRDRLR